MYKASWGQKRICPCNKIRYYDLGREKLDCPECGKEIEVVNLAKPRRGRKPGSLNTQMSGPTVNNPVQDPKPIPEEDLDIESVEDVDIETDNTEIEDDTVLIEDESDIDPTINVGIKNIKEEEEYNN